MAKSQKKAAPSAGRKRAGTRAGTSRRAKPAAGAPAPAPVDPLLQKTLSAVADRARMAGVSPVQYIRGVMTGRYERLSPRELGE